MKNIFSLLFALTCFSLAMNSQGIPPWGTLGNSSTSASSNFIGTTDNVDLVIRTDNSEKVRITASGNIGIGTTAPSAYLNIVMCDADRPLAELHFDRTGCLSAYTPEYFIAKTTSLVSGSPVVRTDFAIKYNGRIGIGLDNPQALTDIYSDGRNDNVLHIEDVNYGELLNIREEGYVGIGAINTGDAMVQISNISMVDIPQLLIDDGTDLYFTVNTAQVGVGIDPDNLSLNSTMALNGSGATSLDLYEPSYTSTSNARIRMIGNGHVRHVITDSGSVGAMIIDPGYDGGANRLRVEGDLVTTGNLAVNGGSNFKERVIVGNVTAPNDDYMLFVEGGILTEEIKVALHTSADWSDYVFSDTYTLPRLDELKKYVIHNKHLPDIPSAEEVVKNGINLGQMDAKLLQKIEELTLYIIALQEDNIKQDKQIESLLNSGKQKKILWHRQKLEN